MNSHQLDPQKKLVLISSRLRRPGPSPRVIALAARLETLYEHRPVTAAMIESLVDRAIQRGAR